MKYISEEDFLASADKSLIAAVIKSIKNAIIKSNHIEGDIGEGFSNYTFDNSETIVVIIYKYKLLKELKAETSFDAYIGKEVNDLVLDKINAIKARAEARGDGFTWEEKQK
ncbi:hypothetical protein Phi4:1_gp153 [Cellulophaga phage phi4:1]|uniref:Uncharacterized protein n=5 Tax=Lightbulbvirus TaxID=1918522 RepID=A0A0S2MWS1_9CAUD|nr:hypothetical protein Phi4:1_gp153 [Cellulophaga phage phi4:1]YP_008241652.1 hypothetical protein Phi17:2_gp157 [Cellulophaga phage phi17:2]ALO80162.1 hypothetical protein Phi4113_153 [Cellulophaga phage phi4:1_13]ALO80359.1 hypothetical protein Phi4118_153 [Cellulophaga phage phi4:1_18]ALO80560.1 hypothetical protein Phi17218_157 [Cellulophaga phage phi17:2_18]AGO47690.1 hypothetical protein Phi17:2_gp157 [Cellulophaga phage phi17:2]AGO49566.1 hypothetical protein Phi4:1_gp153 [Cellulophag